MKRYNNKMLHRMGKEEGKSMHNALSNLQMAIPFDMVQPHVPPTFKHSLKELREMRDNNRGRLIHFIHIYSYEKIKRPIESGDKAKIDLVKKFMHEVRWSKNKKYTLNKKSTDFQVTQESLFSPEQMDEMVVLKKKEAKGQKPL